MDEKTRSGARLNEELPKPVTKKFKRRKDYARFNDNIWARDLAEWSHCLLRIKMLNIYYVS